MTQSPWNPAQYLKFQDDRTRPFIDLLARVGHPEVNTIVDLGCGPGNDTPPLKALWPTASIHGIDSSAAMIDAANASSQDPLVTYAVGDIATWSPATEPDLIVSNAAFQWVPEHRNLLPRIADHAATAFAFQVPGNFDAPSHALLREVAARTPFANFAKDTNRPAAEDPENYLRDLSRPGWKVDAWETTYIHVLQGPDAVFEWIAGTGARPILTALSGDTRDEFIRQYKTELNKAYPRTDIGTVLPFRRIFVVAQRS